MLRRSFLKGLMASPVLFFLPRKREKNPEKAIDVNLDNQWMVATNNKDPHLWVRQHFVSFDEPIISSTTYHDRLFVFTERNAYEIYVDSSLT